MKKEMRTPVRDWVKVVVPIQEGKFHAPYMICSILRIQCISPVKSGVNMRKKVYTNIYIRTYIELRIENDEQMMMSVRSIDNVFD